jgi:hypothetical protein
MIMMEMLMLMLNFEGWIKGKLVEISFPLNGL